MLRGETILRKQKSGHGGILLQLGKQHLLSRIAFDKP